MKARPSAALLLGALALFSLAAVLLAPMFGSQSIDRVSAWSELLGQERSEWSVDARILHVRLPRIALAWLAGGALACCGVVMQTLLRNGLATPYTLGVSAAGSFGAFLFLAFPALASFTTPRVGALVFALLEIFLVLGIARRSRRAEGLILAGVTFNFLFGAGMMLVRYLADPYRLASMDRWLMGALDVVSFDAPATLLPWLLLGGVLVAFRTRALDLLAFDKELAAARGVSVKAAERDLLVGAGILTAAVVSHTGPIGFLGLLVPHALRPFTGMRHALLLPAAWLLGGGFLVLADLLARSIELLGRHSEMPVGILTALVGAPFFLALLVKGR